MGKTTMSYRGIPDMEQSPQPSFDYVVDFVHWTIGVLTGALAGIIAFLTRQIWINTGRIGHLEDNVVEIRARLSDYASERLRIVDDVQGQLRNLERRLAAVEDGLNVPPVKLTR